MSKMQPRSGAEVVSSPYNPHINAVLVRWIGKELHHLNTACFALGQLIPVGKSSFARASIIARRTAEDRGYFDRFAPSDVACCISNGLESGASLPLPANDNRADILVTPSVSLNSLTQPGGLIEELVDWIVSSAERPSRWLALSAVLPFVGALIGRHFESPTGLRTNLYVAALAPSGYGKDHARGQLKKLATEAGLDRVFGPSRFMSATALRNIAMAKPSCVSMIDEFDSLMMQINDPKASMHNALIRTDLKDLWSSATTYFEGSEYAGTSAARIYNPNFCIYGTGTPDIFWKSLSTGNTADGLLPRFILFDTDSERPERVHPTLSVHEIPAGLVEKCQTLSLAGRGSSKLANINVGNTPITAIRLAYDDASEILLEDFKCQVDVKGAAGDSESAPILNRAVEHAIKLATISSVATDPTTAMILGPSMKWAIDLAWQSTSRLIAQAKDKVSDSTREAAYKRLLTQIQEAGDDGITPGVLADKNRNLDKRIRIEILDDLQAAEKIDKLIKSSSSKIGRPSLRYYFRA